MHTKLVTQNRLSIDKGLITNIVVDTLGGYFSSGPLETVISLLGSETERKLFLIYGDLQTSVRMWKIV